MFDVSEPGQSGDPVHPKGRHTYKFSFQLPPNIPASFVGFHGGVEYGIKGCIDKPLAFDHDTTLAFQVVKSLDLNEEELSLVIFIYFIHFYVIFLMFIPKINNFFSMAL